MRVKQPVAPGMWLCFMAVSVAAVSPAVAMDLTHQLTSTWVPATAYGLTLISAITTGQK